MAIITNTIDVQYVRRLLEDIFEKQGYKHKDAVKISDHLIDAELRGYGVAGLSRALSIVDFIRNGTIKVSNTTVERHGPSSASIDGRNGLGYVVAYEATTLAVEIAKENGVAVVAAKNTVCVYPYMVLVVALYILVSAAERSCRGLLLTPNYNRFSPVCCRTGPRWLRQTT